MHAKYNTARFYGTGRYDHADRKEIKRASARAQRRAAKQNLRRFCCNCSDFGRGSS